MTTSTFLDDFNRPDGLPGNGWSEIVGSNYVIQNDVLTPAGAGLEAGVYRPVNLAGPISFSADITQANGDGPLERYVTTILVGNNGDDTSGYGITIYRGDQSYADSAILLMYNGVQLGAVASSFQFGTALSVSFTLSTDGSINGTVSGDGNTFNFSFGPQSVTFAGNNLAIIQDGGDPRGSVIIEPTVDNVQIIEGSPPIDSFISYTDATPNQPTVTDIINAALQYQNSLWFADNCTGLVWAVAESVGAPFYDTSIQLTGVAGQQQIVPDPPGGYVVPHGAGTSGEWITIATTNWQSIVQPGDLVRLPGSDFIQNDPADQAGHSFIVISENSQGQWLVIDNTNPFTADTFPPDGSEPYLPITLHTFNDFLAINPNSAFASDVLNAPVAYVSRLISAPNSFYTGTTVTGTPGQSLAYGNGSVFLDGSDLQNESITAGNGNDVVLGGSQNAVAIGNGNDTVYAGNNDTVSFGNGNDVVTAGDGDKITGGNGNDTIDPGADNTIILGNGSDYVTVDSNSSIKLGNGNDTLNAGDSDTIVFGNGKTVVTVGDGDQVTGGNGNDSINAGANSTITLGNGNDNVTAGSNSVIKLGNGSDTVIGGPEDAITVGNGSDQLVAAPGDVWTVGNGSDIFVFNPGFGNNTITHFNTSRDVIQFNTALFVNYAAAMADTKQVGANTVITYDANDTVTLNGVTASHLTASNFHFS